MYNNKIQSFDLLTALMETICLYERMELLEESNSLLLVCQSEIITEPMYE